MWIASDINDRSDDGSESNSEGGIRTIRGIGKRWVERDGLLVEVWWRDMCMCKYTVPSKKEGAQLKINLGTHTDTRDSTDEHYPH